MHRNQKPIQTQRRQTDQKSDEEKPLLLIHYNNGAEPFGRRAIDLLP
jgi:hypothetical protein